MFVIQILLQPSKIPVTVEPLHLLGSRAKASLCPRTSLSPRSSLILGLKFYRLALVFPLLFNGLRSQLDLGTGMHRLTRTWGFYIRFGPQAIKASCPPSSSQQGWWQSCAQSCMKGTVQAEFLRQSLGACTTNMLQTVRSCTAEHRFLLHQVNYFPAGVRLSKVFFPLDPKREAAPVNHLHLQSLGC